jgi:hypothetical protein
MNKKRINSYNILYLLFLKRIYPFSAAQHKENYFPFFFPPFSPLSKAFDTKFSFFIIFPGYFLLVVVMLYPYMKKYRALASWQKANKSEKNAFVIVCGIVFLLLRGNWRIIWENIEAFSKIMRLLRSFSSDKCCVFLGSSWGELVVKLEIKVRSGIRYSC